MAKRNEVASTPQALTLGQIISRRLTRSLSPWVQRLLSLNGQPAAPTLAAGLPERMALSSREADLFLKRIERTVSHSRVWQPSLDVFCLKELERFEQAVEARHQVQPINSFSAELEEPALAPEIELLYLPPGWSVGLAPRPAAPQAVRPAAWQPSEEAIRRLRERDRTVNRSAESASPAEVSLPTPPEPVAAAPVKRPPPRSQGVRQQRAKQVAQTPPASDPVKPPVRREQAGPKPFKPAQRDESRAAQPPIQEEQTNLYPAEVAEAALLPRLETERLPPAQSSPESFLEGDEARPSTPFWQDEKRIHPATTTPLPDSAPVAPAPASPASLPPRALRRQAVNAASSSLPVQPKAGRGQTGGPEPQAQGPETMTRLKSGQASPAFSNPSQAVEAEQATVPPRQPAAWPQSPDLAGPTPAGAPLEQASKPEPVAGQTVAPTRPAVPTPEEARYIEPPLEVSISSKPDLNEERAITPRPLVLPQTMPGAKPARRQPVNPEAGRHPVNISKAARPAPVVQPSEPVQGQVSLAEGHSRPVVKADWSQQESVAEPRPLASTQTGAESRPVVKVDWSQQESEAEPRPLASTQTGAEALEAARPVTQAAWRQASQPEIKSPSPEVNPGQPAGFALKAVAAARFEPATPDFPGGAMVTPEFPESVLATPDQQVTPPTASLPVGQAQQFREVSAGDTAAGSPPVEATLQPSRPARPAVAERLQADRKPEFQPAELPQPRAQAAWQNEPPVLEETATDSLPATVEEARSYLQERGWRFKENPGPVTTSPTQIARAVASLENERSSGRPLEAQPRALLERVTGRDLGEARIHTKPLEGLGVQAATRGRDIYLSPEHDQLDTSQSLALLGHEVAHTSQDTRPAGAGPALQRQVARDEAGAGQVEQRVQAFFQEPALRRQAAPGAGIEITPTTVAPMPEELADSPELFRQQQLSLQVAAREIVRRGDLENLAKAQLAIAPKGVDTLPITKLPDHGEVQAVETLEEKSPLERTKETVMVEKEVELDLDDIARQVYPYLKRLLAVDQERRVRV